MKSAARPLTRPSGSHSYLVSALVGAATFATTVLMPLSTHAQASAPASTPATSAATSAASAPAGVSASAPAVPVAATAAAHPPAKTKPDLAKGQAIATQVCATCHTVDGSRGTPAYPILQGQHPEYMVKQLIEFKNDKRNNPIMKAMAAALSDADMKNVSAFYGNKMAKSGFAKSKESVALGEKIYRGGIADKSVPACAACHSPDGGGLPVRFPRIGGQHADYTEAQLVAFRTGARGNGPMMVAIAAKMSDKEIKAVSDYIAGLQRLASATPAP
jgi:cytochrome c553